MKHSSLLRLAALLVAGLAAPAGAATIGYWQFENPTNLGLDSGSLGLNLADTGAVSPVSTPFPATVPQTGDANATAASFAAGSGQYLSVTDPTAFNFQDFTIEAYVSLSTYGSGTSSRIIAGQTNGSSAFGWQFGAAGSSSSLGAGALFLQFSKSGASGSTSILGSGVSLALGHDYYVAASVDFTLGTGASVTFYVEDLTAGGPLISQTVTDSRDSFFYSASTPFSIGADDNGSSSRRFDGTIDQVRLSDVALTEGMLLAVPEPGGVSLGSLAVIVGVLLGRRRRAARRS